MANLLNDMALYVEVVKVRSFTRAAQILEMPNSTLSRRISELEKAIGLRLLHRTTRRVEPTEAGQIYFNRCKRIVEEAQLAHDQLGDMLAQPTGLLRISLPVDFGTLYLPPLIAEFAALYPGISFDFDLSPRRIDLVTEPFDVAIRMGELKDSALIARPLVRYAAGIYASADYLARHGEPQSPDDLNHHQCIGMARVNGWTLYRAGESVQVQVSSRFHMNSIGLIGRLTALGLGIGLLPDMIAQEAGGVSGLRRILPEWQGAPVTAYAVTETRLLPAKTQRFIDFLRARLRGLPAPQHA